MSHPTNDAAPESEACASAANVRPNGGDGRIHDEPHLEDEEVVGLGR